MHIVYSERMSVESNDSFSPSAQKPALVAEAIRKSGLPVNWVEPRPSSFEELAAAHDPEYVKGVLMGKLANGFGNMNAEIAKSLPFTNGAMTTAAELAIATKQPAFALCSGFHHARYRHGGNFCTFNGLMVAALSILDRKLAGRIAIIDCDQHYGDGTNDILCHAATDSVLHISYGEYFHTPKDATKYLFDIQGLEPLLKLSKVDLILFQAGADVHVDDPLGGVLNTEQMKERDRAVFGYAQRLGIPLALNLAGGYQKDANGGISKVVDLHLNTLRVGLEVFGAKTNP